MFTIEQIEAAHAKVKSGADFPNYIKDIKMLGVKGFETWTKDSHTEYHGDNDYKAQSQPMYAVLVVADDCSPDEFARRLKVHQQGKTDYMQFCRDCAETGVEKWIVSIEAMTCIYYDKAGNEVLAEKIPG